MSQNLCQASREWATRPADERYEKLEDMYLATLLAANTGVAKNCSVGDLEAVIAGNDIQLKSPFGNLKFNNWSFNQMASRIGAPGSYLATLPNDIAIDAINDGIKKNKEVEAQLWYDETTQVNRAITSQSYARIFNHEIVKALIELPGKWVTPPARPAMEGQPGTRIATEEDCKCSTLIKPGDTIAPAGLYASDRDMFAFLVDPENRIEDGSDGGLSRGFFIRNSEVGNSTFEIVTFYYRYTCGNHIVWGAENVEILSVKHIGRGARGRAFDRLSEGLKVYADSSAQDDIAKIKLAKTTDLGKTYEEVIDFVFRNKKIVSKSDATNAYELANEFADVDGSPRSIWGFAQGLTRLSQRSLFADQRNKLDKAAGKLLSLVN